MLETLHNQNMRVNIWVKQKKKHNKKPIHSFQLSDSHQTPNPFTVTKITHSSPQNESLFSRLSQFIVASIELNKSSRTFNLWNKKTALARHGGSHLQPQLLER
jgi:hypothetical protein